VNRAFVQRVLGNSEALGRRFRYRDVRDTDAIALAPETWYEIVGVVADLQTNAVDPTLVDPNVFHMLAPSQSTVLTLIVRTRGGEASGLADRVRSILAALDPTARITPRPMLELYRQMDLALRLVALVLGLITLSVLLLSAAGIYALMAFTVAQRRKEIGIRAALGADAKRLLISIFSRAAGQLGAGVAAGVVLAIALDAASSGEALGTAGLTALPVIAIMMVGVGLLAAFGPARRGLRVQPTEALRDQ
jgi:putative ABC transport system permease protein